MERKLEATIMGYIKLLTKGRFRVLYEAQGSVPNQSRREWRTLSLHLKHAHNSLNSLQRVGV